MARWKKGMPSPNPNGRTPGITNKVPSNKEIKDTLKKGNNAAFKKLMAIIANGKEDNALKAAIKILDINYEIILEEEKSKTKGKASVVGKDGENELPKSNVRKLVIPRE